jgi:hypothetical protein
MSRTAVSWIHARANGTNRVCAPTPPRLHPTRTPERCPRGEGAHSCGCVSSAERDAREDPAEARTGRTYTAGYVYACSTCRRRARRQSRIGGRPATETAWCCLYCIWGGSAFDLVKLPKRRVARIIVGIIEIRELTF